MLFRAVRAAHGFNLTTEWLQGGVNSRISFIFVIGSCLIFSELWKWVWHALVIVPHDIPKSSCQVTRGTRRARWSRLTRRTLILKNLEVCEHIVFVLFFYWTKAPMGLGAEGVTRQHSCSIVQRDLWLMPFLTRGF